MPARTNTSLKDFRTRTRKKVEKRTSGSATDVFGQDDPTQALGRDPRSGVERQIGDTASALSTSTTRQVSAVEENRQRSLERVGRLFSLDPGGLKQGRAIRVAGTVEAGANQSLADIEARQAGEQRANIATLQGVQQGTEQSALAADAAQREATGQQVNLLGQESQIDIAQQEQDFQEALRSDDLALRTEALALQNKIQSGELTIAQAAQTLAEGQAVGAVDGASTIAQQQVDIAKTQAEAQAAIERARVAGNFIDPTTGKNIATLERELAEADILGTFGGKDTFQRAVTEAQLSGKLDGITTIERLRIENQNTQAEAAIAEQRFATQQQFGLSSRELDNRIAEFNAGVEIQDAELAEQIRQFNVNDARNKFQYAGSLRLENDKFLADAAGVVVGAGVSVAQFAENIGLDPSTTSFEELQSSALQRGLEFDAVRNEFREPEIVSTQRQQFKDSLEEQKRQFDKQNQDQVDQWADQFGLSEDEFNASLGDFAKGKNFENTALGIALANSGVAQNQIASTATNISNQIAQQEKEFSRSLSQQKSIHDFNIKMAIAESTGKLFASDLSLDAARDAFGLGEGVSLNEVAEAGQAAGFNFDPATNTFTRGEALTTLAAQRQTFEEGIATDTLALQRSGITGELDENSTVQERQRLFNNRMTETQLFGGSPPLTINTADLNIPIGTLIGDPAFRPEFDIDNDGVFTRADHLGVAARSDDLGNGTYIYTPPGPATLAAKQFGLDERRLAQAGNEFNDQFNLQKQEFLSDFGGVLVDEDGNAAWVYDAESGQYVQPGLLTDERLELEIDLIDQQLTLGRITETQANEQTVTLQTQNATLQAQSKSQIANFNAATEKWNDLIIGSSREFAIASGFVKDGPGYDGLDEAARANFGVLYTNLIFGATGPGSSGQQGASTTNALVAAGAKVLSSIIESY